MNCLETSKCFFEKHSNGRYKNSVIISEDYESITCNHEIYKLLKIIGEGSYGIVSLYETGNGKQVILKKEKGAATEIKISKILEKESCSTIFLRHVLSNDNGHFYVMNKMTGDVNSMIVNVIKNIPDKVCATQKYLQLIEDVRSQIHCLARKGYYYTDIKGGNILYCLEEATLSVALGDLGSVYVDDQGDQVSTFPPPEYSSGGGFVEIDKENYNSVLSWGLGTLVLHLILHDYGKLTWHNGHYIKRNLPDVLEKFKQQQLDTEYITQEQFMLIKSMLSLDPEERPDIRKPFYEFLRYENSLPVARILEFDDEPAQSVNEFLDRDYTDEELAEMEEQMNEMDPSWS